MSYIENNLLRDETILYTTTRHWIIFVLPIIFLILGFVFVFQASLLVLLGYIFLFVGVVQLISALIIFITSEYGVTNKRVLVKLGFIKRDSFETLISKIAGIRVDQSILGRMLNYGTIVIQSTGVGQDVFRMINKPLIFRRKVQAQIEELTSSLEDKPQEKQADKQQDEDAIIANK